MEPNNNNPQSEESVNTQMDNTYLEEKRSFINIIKTKKVALGLVALVALFAISAFAYILMSNRNISDEETEVIIEEARKAYNTGDLQLVRNKLEKAYIDFPEDPGIQAALIKTIANQGNLTGMETNSYSQAQNYTQKALQDNPDNLEVLIAVGYLEETAGNYQKALEYYQEAVTIDGSNSEAWFHLGHVLHFLGRYDEAENAYITSYEHDSQNPLALIAMGNIATNENRLDDAYAYFKSASELPDISPHIKAEALTAASITRRMQILYMEEATSLAKEAVDISPNFSPALAAYGYVLSINGNPADGFEYLKKSIEANPRISQNYYLGAQVLRAAGMYEDAISYQAQAIEKVANDNTILGTEVKNGTRALYTYDLAKTYSISGGHPETVTLLQEAISLNPDLREVLLVDYREHSIFRELSSNTDFQSFL